MTDRVGPALANLKLRDGLRELALRDGLTGLYNRRYVEDALNREIHRPEYACERAEQMRLAIRDANLTHLGQTLPAPTASFGVAVYPANGTKPANLLKAAPRGSRLN